MKRFFASLCFIIMLTPATITHAGQSNVSTCVQTEYLLKSFGYAVGEVGVCNTRTTKAIMNFQRVSHLRVDGIAGPITWAAMVNAAATATEQAVRLTPPTPQVMGPGNLTGCARMTWYRVNAGLPERFDAIGWRESNCRNDVTSSTGCCHGFWQISFGNRTAPGYRAGFIACGVFQVSDYKGNSDSQMRANACLAKVLYDVSGMSPWSL